MAFLLLALIHFSTSQSPYIVYPYPAVMDYLSSQIPNNSRPQNFSMISPFRIPPNFSEAKPKILFISSIHGGFPLATSLSLSLINSFLGKSNLTEKIIRTADILFVPVANPPAYQTCDRLLRDNKTVPYIWSDMQGRSWNCSYQFSGIDPDLNFQEGFKQIGTPCSESGYSGSAPFTSNVTLFIANLFSVNPPLLTFLFDGEGKNILYPPTSNSGKLSAKLAKFYASLNASNFTYGGYSTFSPLKSGTLLDYINKLGRLGFLVNVNRYDDNNTGLIDSQIQFIYNTIDYTFCRISANINSVIVSPFLDSSNYSNTINIEIEVNSERFIDLLINASLFLSIDNVNNYEFIHVQRTDKFGYQRNDENSTLGSSGKALNQSFGLNIEGFSTTVLTFSFAQISDSDIRFYFELFIAPQMNSSYFDGIYLNYTFDNYPSSNLSKGDKLDPAIISGILLIILLFIMAITGVILYFKSKTIKKNEKGFTFGPS